MRRKNTEQIDCILNRFLRNEGLETPLNEYRLVNAWSEVMGAAVTRYTGKVSIYNRTLYVELLSPALRSNLFMRRVELVRRLNAYVNADVISDVRFV